MDVSKYELVRIDILGDKVKMTLKMCLTKEVAIRERKVLVRALSLYGYQVTQGTHEDDEMFLEFDYEVVTTGHLIQEQPTVKLIIRLAGLIS